MSHPRALNEQRAIELERWFSDYQRIGTIADKCRELGITKVTLYETVRRVRRVETRVIRRKINALTLETLANAITAKTIGASGIDATFHVERGNEPRNPDEQ